MRYLKLKFSNNLPNDIWRKNNIKSNNKIVTDPKDIKVNSELQTILKNEIIHSTVTKKSKHENRFDI